MRISWRTVGHIIARVTAEATAPAPTCWPGWRRIGIDEISYKRGHKYLVVVVDHDSGRLVWAAPGREANTVASAFFDRPRRRPGRDAHPRLCRRRRLDRRRGRRPRAAGRVVRRPVPRRLLGHRRTGRGPPRGLAASPGRPARSPAARIGSRRPAAVHRRRPRPQARPLRAVEKPWRTSPAAQQAKLAWIEKTHPRLYRAYLLKEGLRLVFQLKGEEGKYALGPLAILGSPLPHPRIHRARPQDPQAPVRPSTPPSTTASATA